MKCRIGVAAAIAFALVVTLGGCGGSSGPSKEEIKEAEHTGAERAQQHAKIHQIEEQLRDLRHGSKQNAADEGSAPESPSAPAPEGTSSSGNCGGGLSVNQYTTCPFAENVESAYFEEIGSGSGTVEAWSPAKERTYVMYCTSGEPHECTGGNNAAVFFP